MRFENEMVWAFQVARDGDEATAQFFISVIGNEADGNSNVSPNLTNTGLTSDTGAIIIDGDHVYMVFDGFDALSDPLSQDGVFSVISDTTNWTVDGAGRNPVNSKPLVKVGFTNITPLRAYDPNDVRTLYFSGDHVAFIDDMSSGDNDFSTDLSVSEQPFLPADILAIDILNDPVWSDGEFDFDEVIFVSVQFKRDDVTYEFVVNDGSKIKESGATDTESGQAVEQGDTFSVTHDDVNSFVAAPRGISLSSGLPSGRLAFALNATFVDGGVTNIVREQSLVDENGLPVGDENANFFTGLSLLPPPPCFCEWSIDRNRSGGRLP
ncbi:hypothetical protein [Shimia sp. SDUM112013]|uniref:hypothetical protein n=1 Tax=Shimia sp. SDUM112013 TaxID=3136160 RepID=UPI0032ECA36F